MAKAKDSTDQLGLFGSVVEPAPAPKPPAPAPKPPHHRALPAREALNPRESVARPAPQQEPEVLTVARLDFLLRRVVERATTSVLVQGEVSGVHRAGSGHVYFTLKDQHEDALIDCVMYRTSPVKARKALADGERVVLSGHVTLYAPRGRLQLIADNVLQTQRGALLEALERLKKKLAAEGLFDPSRKKPLPSDPQRIAVLTSRAGAAIHDVIRVASRRGRVQILLVPTPVQGFGAAERIARAIAFSDRLGLDALIVTRGGGSAEDLAAYNDEAVVRAIAACHTPVLSAVGHEIDVSLSDLAADARAATPSQAAEMLVPDDRQRREHLAHLEQRLVRAVRHHIVAGRERFVRLWAAVDEPRRRLLEHSQRFDELAALMERAIRRLLASRRGEHDTTTRRLQAQHPRRVTAEARHAITRLEPRLASAMRERLVRERRHLAELAPKPLASIQHRVTEDRRRLERAVAQLDAMSPLKVLARGYAIATDAEGHVLMTATEANAGDDIRVRLHDGTLSATVKPP